MAVRKTERSIPGGFTEEHAKKLGYPKQVDDYILVSYLGKKVKYSIGEITYPIKNTYVIFVDDGAEEPDSYEWRFSFFVEGVDAPIEYNVSTPNGIFSIDTSNLESLENLNIIRVDLNVVLNGTDKSIFIDHQVVSLNVSIEALFKDNNAAIGGKPEITRLLGNDYKEYLKQTYLSPKNLVAAFLYLQLLHTDEEERQENLEYWTDYIENIDSYSADGSEPNALKKTPLGIANIKPHFIKMFLASYNGTEDGSQNIPAANIDFWDEENDDESEYANDLLQAYKTLTVEQKIHLFNLLRFPKSCIILCSAYLHALLKQHTENAWHDLDEGEIIENKECVETICSEYKRGPSKNLKDFTEIGEKVFGTLFTKYIETIIDKDYINYKTVRVKILDIRSGRPIINTRIKKLFVYGEKGADKRFFGEQNKAVFGYSHSKITQANIPDVKDALSRLGYNPGGGIAWNGQAVTAYEAYWSDRLLDNSITSSAGTTPDSYYLTRIIDEYNSHAFSNDQGIVEVKIPKKFLDERIVYIDIGFWEFPISLEELEDDSREYPISRGDYEEKPTNFRLDWTAGDDINNQELDFDASVKGLGDFGWTVLTEDQIDLLKVAIRINLKINNEPFSEYDTDLLSKFYDDTGNHFVLFGMQWCQATWDEFEDVSNGNAGDITLKTYIQDPTYRGKHIHLVTMPYDFTRPPIDVCSDLYGGKGYGKYETEFGNTSRWRDIDNPPPPPPPTPGHKGYDIHAKEGELIFALHCGIVSNVDNGTHIKCRLNFSNTVGYSTLTYLHLSAHIACQAVNSKRVMAGEIIARSGRTDSSADGRYPDISPSHVHVNVGTHIPMDNAHKYLPRLTESLRNNYFHNACVLPNNDSPLLFPCACEVIAPDPQNCNFTPANLNYISNCWAVAELKCPYINPEDKGDIKLQAQLRHLKERNNAIAGGFTDDVNNNPNYFHPGTIDGALLDPAVNVNISSLTNGKAVQLLAGSEHGGRLIQTRFTQDDGQIKEGWIEASLIDAGNLLTLPNWAGTDTLSNLVENSIGKTRMAIYMFRKANERINFLDYASNFSMNDEIWELLNENAVVTIPITE